MTRLLASVRPSWPVKGLGGFRRDEAVEMLLVDLSEGYMRERH
jgi:hypothetical protein